MEKELAYRDEAAAFRELAASAEVMQRYGLVPVAPGV
jgi:hypothetical protein